jgi:hypothetical protein
MSGYCVVSRDLDRYQAEIDAAEREDMALDAITAELHAEYLADENHIDLALSFAPDAIYADPMQRDAWVDDYLWREAKAAAPDELKARIADAEDDRAYDRYMSRMEDAA